MTLTRCCPTAKGATARHAKVANIVVNVASHFTVEFPFRML
jgi:hypothetical protein